MLPASVWKFWMSWLVERVGDAGGAGRDRHRAVVGQQLLHVGLERVVDEVVGELLVGGVLRHHEQVAARAGVERVARPQERAPAEVLDVALERAGPPAAGHQHRVLAGLEVVARLGGGQAHRVLGDVALLDPVLERVRGVGPGRVVEVHRARVPLVVLHLLRGGLAQLHLIQVLHRHVVVARVRERGDARLDELGHRRGQLRHRGGHRRSPYFANMRLVVVDHQVLGVVGDAVPVARAHDALGVVLRGDLQVGPEQLVPAVLGRLRREVGEQALLGQQPGGRVALVVLHDVGDVGGVEDHRGVLLHLVEALQRELHVTPGCCFLKSVMAWSQAIW